MMEDLREIKKKSTATDEVKGCTIDKEGITSTCECSRSMSRPKVAVLKFQT